MVLLVRRNLRHRRSFRRDVALLRLKTEIVEILSCFSVRSAHLGRRCSATSLLLSIARSADKACIFRMWSNSPAFCRRVYATSVLRLLAFGFWFWFWAPVTCCLLPVP